MVAQIERTADDHDLGADQFADLHCFVSVDDPREVQFLFLEGAGDGLTIDEREAVFAGKHGGNGLADVLADLPAGLFRGEIQHGHGQPGLGVGFLGLGLVGQDETRPRCQQHDTEHALKDRRAFHGETPGLRGMVGTGGNAAGFSGRVRRLGGGVGSGRESR